jgi:phosphoribosylformylglycinamidine synthase
VVRFPVAHGEGNYYADGDTLRRLEGDGRVLFRYVSPAGAATDEANRNGSRLNIAGILNEPGNVLGLMPHPENHIDPLVGGTDGRPLFESLLAA